jgi:hypothetical protein
VPDGSDPSTLSPGLRDAQQRYDAVIGTRPPNAPGRACLPLVTRFLPAPLAQGSRRPRRAGTRRRPGTRPSRSARDGAPCAARSPSQPPLAAALPLRSAHAGTRVAQPVQPLAQGVAGDQVDAHGAGHRDQHVAARHLRRGGVGEDGDGGGKPEPGVDDPPELVGARADETGLVGASASAPTQISGRLTVSAM